MPIFEYLCEDCGTKFEKLVRNAASKEGVLCPSCGQEHLKQEYSTFAARANGGSSEQAMPQCASGMCQNPGFCGRN